MKFLALCLVLILPSLPSFAADQRAPIELNAWVEINRPHPLWEVLKAQEERSETENQIAVTKTVGPVSCTKILNLGQTDHRPDRRIGAPFMQTFCSVQSNNDSEAAVELYDSLHVDEVEQSTVKFKRLGRLLVQRDRHDRLQSRNNRVFYTDKCLLNETDEQRNECLEFWTQEVMNDYNAPNSFYLLPVERDQKLALINTIYWAFANGSYQDEVRESVKAKLATAKSLGLSIVWGDEATIQYYTLNEKKAYPQEMFDVAVVDLAYSENLIKTVKTTARDRMMDLKDIVASSFILRADTLYDKKKNSGIRSIIMWIHEEIEMILDDL